jgi:hypothetical protein
MYLLINLADNNNARTGAAEVDMVALPCRRLDDLAQQIALKHYARMQMIQHFN